MKTDTKTRDILATLSHARGVTAAHAATLPELCRTKNPLAVSLALRVARSAKTR